MAPSAAANSPPSPENTECNLQPFFVLHKALPSNSERKSMEKTASRKRTRRRIDLSPSSPKSSEQSEAEFAGDHHLRTDAFRYVWSKIDSTIKNVLRNINADVFNDILFWVQESFNTTCSCGMPDRAKATRSYPVVTGPLSKQIYTGLVFTQNMELVDDLLTFKDLGLHLTSHGCHVANLSSFDFSAKNGIDGCLRGLLRQFLLANLDVADMSILASWYIDQGNYENPMVVIIDDMERCCGSVLSQFILMLSEWTVKMPIILIVGVATTVDALSSILPSYALQYLSCHKFILGSPADRMEAVIEAVLVKQCSGFSVGHNVAIFLRNYFFRQDGTLTSFVRALKIAIVQHISMEPLSFMLKGLSDEDSQDLWSESPVFLPELFKRAFDLPSFRRNELTETNEEILARGLSDLKRLKELWSSAVMCLYEAGKGHKITMFDLYCETLDPELHHSRVSDHHLGLETKVGMSSSDHQIRERLQNCGFIHQVIRKVRDLPEVLLCQLLKNWEKHTKGIIEIHAKVRELQSSLKFEDDKGLKQGLTDLSKRQKIQSNFNIEKDAKRLNEKTTELIIWMVKNYMLPIECIPFHEIICFTNVSKLQSALIGDPRRTIQVDLLEFHKILKCKCCSKSGNNPLPSMHDTSIMYVLTQEHGDLINLHDWYQSFKASILHPRIKRKHRLKHSPSPKKKMDTSESRKKSEASVQAQFSRAVTELQITGLLRMPTKRRPDYVQRVAFGL
ncbi:Origin of replication complex subunit like [Actinidia chinensis var. chinensis]|uniref:Origin of replication complex subunit like n=1 Tax=Actinidia chinensis var. chinensis TaxID=1590841 RepID=A0A2R6Q9M3_ACTCC|nr:Origin of replication complex subunit like [Actinidia chinensis var. chinensis]